MISTHEIITVIRTLKSNTHHFHSTALTNIANLTKNPFHVLISCILSLRTKDAITAEASRRLYHLADTPETMMHLTEQQIQKTIYPVGFYKTKAKRIKNICTTLVQHHNGKVPQTMEELLHLKGVGRKTAGIVMCYGHHTATTIPVDSHVHQITNRLGWANTKTPEQTEQALVNIIPKHYWHDFNNLFVQFGQNICVPVSPWCTKCPIKNHCKRIGVTKSR